MIWNFFQCELVFRILLFCILLLLFYHMLKIVFYYW